jgi:hypothetical protein
MQSLFHMVGMIINEVITNVYDIIRHDFTEWITIYHIIFIKKLLTIKVVYI